MKTAYNIINDAFKKLGAIGETETLNTYQQGTGNKALAAMAHAWTVYGLPPWNMAVDSIPLSNFAANGTLIVGKSGLTVVPTYSSMTNYPVRILNAWKQKSNVREPMMVMARKDFLSQPSQALTAAPQYLLWEPLSWRRIKLSLYPLISTDWTSGTLVIDYQYDNHPTSEYTDPSTEYPDFPDYWDEALIYNLAVRLAPEYGLSIENRNLLKQEAKEALELALSYRTDDTESMYFQPARS